MGFLHNSAFSPALDQCRQSLRIRDAGKAISKRGVVGTKIAREKAMPRYSALVAGASMPVAAQLSLTGVRNSPCLLQSSSFTASYHVEGVERHGQHNPTITRGSVTTAAGALDCSFLEA